MANLLALVLFLSLYCVCHSAKITCDNIMGLEGCACKMSDSMKSVSLQELAIKNNTAGKIRFNIATGDAWSYAYQPCGTFNMFLNAKNPIEGYYACKDATVGRFTSRSVQQCEGLGDLSESAFEFHENFTYPIVSNLTVTFTNTTSNHAARISLICDTTLTAANTEFKYLNVTEGPIEYYEFSLRGPCSCPGGCNLTPTPTPTPDPSAGAWINPNFALMSIVSFIVVMLQLNRAY